ncbi:MAG TPA: hypothetical protein VFA12_20660 [Stellaceae bacterium]|nr:hypothetical protein [Stellaceae bacterium]
MTDTDDFIAAQKARQDTDGCPACGFPILLPHQRYCNDCEKLKRQRDDAARRARRYDYFGFDPWAGFRR